MKTEVKIRLISILLFVTSFAYAHEDYYQAIELSNVHLKIMVGYKSSLQLNVAKSYASLINDFVREIAPKQKVFIQFNEDYCFTGYSSFYMSYGKFKEKLIPKGFPFLYNYNLGFINTEKGLSIIVEQQYFKLKPLLQLIEFGLNNEKKIEEEGQIFSSSYIKSDTKQLLNSIINRKQSKLCQRYLNKKTNFIGTPKILKVRKVSLFLKHDSVFLALNKTSRKILSVPTLYFITTDEDENCMFLLNTEKSFYFINNKLKSNNKQYKLTFSVGCIDGITIDFLPDKSIFKLWKTDIISVKDKEHWTLFSETRGIINN